MTKDRRKRKSGSFRQRWPRLKPSDIPFLKSVEVSQGSEIEIVNISRVGLLLETETRLGPDMKIRIKLVTTKGVFEMDGITLRSTVFSLEGAPRYRTAIIFSEPFDLMDALDNASQEKVQEVAVGTITSGNSGTTKDQQPQQGNTAGRNEKPPAVLTVVASDANGICLNESFELNDW